jgi:hypothetical protein
MLVSGNLDLGAPVLDFVQNAEKVVSDGIVTAKGYAPVKLTPTASNANYLVVNSYKELSQVD